MNPSIKDTKENVVHFFQDFKNFALKSSAIDMALGIIIGTAFSKVISSLVSDILMPPLGIIVGGVNFVDLKLLLKDAVTNEAGVVTQAAVTINYGHFLQVFIDFMIVAFSVFLAINMIRKVFHTKMLSGNWQNFMEKPK